MIEPVARQRCDRINWRRGGGVSHNAVWMFMRREGLRFKRTLFAPEHGRADVGRRRPQVGCDPSYDQSRQRKALVFAALISAAILTRPPGQARGQVLNPIEQTSSKIKHWMRAPQKRTLDDICRHLGDLVTTIPVIECSNYFKNAGYDSIKT